jgi:hypothetical protein
MCHLCTAWSEVQCQPFKSLVGWALFSSRSIVSRKGRRTFWVGRWRTIEEAGKASFCASRPAGELVALRQSLNRCRAGFRRDLTTSPMRPSPLSGCAR